MPITIKPFSKYHIPNIETIIAPIRSYNLSIKTNGAVLDTGTSNLSFSNFDLINSPNWPGVAESEKLAKNIIRLGLIGIEISKFFKRIDHLTKSTSQLAKIVLRINGK